MRMRREPVGRRRFEKQEAEMMPWKCAPCGVARRSGESRWQA